MLTTQISAFSKALGDTRSMADKRKLLLSVPTINKSTSDDEDEADQPAKRPKQAVSVVRSAEVLAVAFCDRWLVVIYNTKYNDRFARADRA